MLRSTPKVCVSKHVASPFETALLGLPQGEDRAPTSLGGLF